MANQVGKSLVAVMAMGMFVVVLDNTIMNVSISALVEDLNTTVSGVQAAIALNALMMAAFVLMGGKLADIMGMKKTFLTGAVFYVCGSLLASMSNNLAVFILGWCAIQGFGAAMMLPNVNTIIRAYISGPARAQAYGMIAGINALGTAVGPIIGGFLTTYFSWRWAFRIEVAILLGVLVMGKVIPKDVMGKVRPALDKLGVMWQALAMMLLVLGTLFIADYGVFMAKQPFTVGGVTLNLWGLSIVPFLWAVGGLCLWLFVRHEKQMDKDQKEGLVDLRLFSIRAYNRGNIVRFIQMFLFAGAMFAVPLYLQVTYGLTAFETGFILLGLTAGLLVTALSGNKRGMKYLPKHKIMIGYVTMALGALIMMAAVGMGATQRSLLPGLFVYGMGMGLIASQIMNLVLSAVEPKQTAEASGVTSTLDTLGSSFGTAIVGTVLVVALTTGISNQVTKSEVFPPELKTQIDQDMAVSVEVVSSTVISDTITEDGAYEAEAVRIYDTARQNAFMITMLFMAMTAGAAFLLSKGLPATRVTGDVEA